MSAFPAVILLQVIYVHSATVQPYPYFVGHMVNQMYNDQNASTLFGSQRVRGFSTQDNSPGIYNAFRVPEPGIYWISLRPMDVASAYHVRVDEVIVATAESPQRRKSAVGFARFLPARSVVRVTRNTYSLVVTYEQLTYVDSIFSITLIRRTRRDGAGSLFWTAKYIVTELNEAVLVASPRAIFSYDAGLAIDKTRRSRMFSWYFVAPFDAIYWISIRAVPDDTMTRGSVRLELLVGRTPQLLFMTWVKDGLGSYVSRPVFLNKDMTVTVSATYTEIDNRRIGFTEDTMVSVVPVQPEYHWVVAEFPEPYEAYQLARIVFGRDIDGQKPPSHAERQDAYNSELRRSLHPHLSGIGRQRRNEDELPCQQLVQFSRIPHDPQGLVRNANSTIILRKSGLYLISLRNDPVSIPRGTTAVMQVYCESSGVRAKLLRVTCFPPPDTSLPEGADAAYYLQRGDKLWVERYDTRGVDYGTIWSIALVSSA